MCLKGLTAWEDLTGIQQSYILAYHQTREHDETTSSTNAMKAMFGGK